MGNAPSGAGAGSVGYAAPPLSAGQIGSSGWRGDPGFAPRPEASADANLGDDPFRGTTVIGATGPPYPQASASDLLAFLFAPFGDIGVGAGKAMGSLYDGTVAPITAAENAYITDRGIDRVDPRANPIGALGQAVGVQAGLAVQAVGNMVGLGGHAAAAGVGAGAQQAVSGGADVVVSGVGGGVVGAVGGAATGIGNAITNALDPKAGGSPSLLIVAGLVIVAVLVLKR